MEHRNSAEKNLSSAKQKKTQNEQNKSQKIQEQEKKGKKYSDLYSNRPQREVAVGKVPNITVYTS